ncbi:MAG: glutathione S-transferase [Alphaproteobacteria bacterium]|nr:glutathione S-transferase [Alphaproteobacteria bacterium]MBM3653239.1 glutathione S-transferase [Alphaproteobacteria bacterium]
MLFYNTPLAPNPRRVRIFLAEKNVTIPTRDVNLLAQEHKKDAYSAVNALEEVPALLLDDGAVLTESVAICRYIESLHPEPPLLGRDAREQAFVEMWQRRVEFRLFAPVAFAFRHSHPALARLESPQRPEFAEFQRPRAQQMMRFLDQELASRRFMASDDFTIADITAIVAMDLAKLARIDIPDDLANLSRWRTEVSARPSVVP